MATHGEDCLVKTYALPDGHNPGKKSEVDAFDEDQPIPIFLL